MRREIGKVQCEKETGTNSKTEVWGAISLSYVCFITLFQCMLSINWKVFLDLSFFSFLPRIIIGNGVHSLPVALLQFIS